MARFDASPNRPIPLWTHRYRYDMENETTAAAVAPAEELRRELQSLSSELRSAISDVQTDLHTMIREMKRLSTDVNRVQRDVYYSRLFTIEDVSGLRSRMDELRSLLARRIDERRTLDDLAERIARLERV